jgi:hypothetical protein
MYVTGIMAGVSISAEDFPSVLEEICCGGEEDGEGHKRKKRYLKIIKQTVFRLGSNIGGSSTTPQDWITFEPRSTPCASESRKS